jgi:ligand-binding sensor domain-containing protein
MRFVITAYFLGIIPTLFAQIGMGEWRMHHPITKAIDLAVGNDVVLAALSSGVIEYDESAGENKVYNRLNGLSDINVTCIVYEPTSFSFFIGYENGNVDQLLKNGKIINIPGIKLAQILGNKRINKLTTNNGLVYAATGFAIVVIDPKKSEIKDTYYPVSGQSNFNDVAIINDTIFALTDNQLFRSSISNPFLAAPTQWSVDNRIVPTATAKLTSLGVLNNELLVLYKNEIYGADSILKFTPLGTSVLIGNLFDMEIVNFSIEGTAIHLYYNDAFIVFNANEQIVFSVNSYGNVISSPSKAFARTSGGYWIADNRHGLVKAYDAANFSFINQSGPPKNNFFSVNSLDDKVVVTGGLLDRVQLNYNLSGAYVFQDEDWTLYDRENQSMWNGANVWDIATAAFNPKNKSQLALAGYCVDALSIVTDNQVSELYNASNSALESTTLGNGFVCISNIEYDEKGNLWISNCYSNKPLKVLLKDGTWQSMESGTETNGAFTSELAIDYNGNKWMGIYGKGLLGYNDNETPENIADDTYKLLKSGEGFGNLPSENITAIAVDFDNEVWIGTENGFVVLYNSNGIFNSNYIDASRILVNFEGNVEELLNGTAITDIEIDGGNRKWIATANTGIFLLSADGQDVIKQYTKENSSLISNAIMDMEFNSKTGELFVVTDQGMVSLRADASAEDATYDAVTVFPNPVKPDYAGPITIQGIRYDSDVRITDAAGRLVYKTTSNGGTATWNGKTMTGAPVATGVYFIWTATNENLTSKDRKVGKVVVVR